MVYERAGQVALPKDLIDVDAVINAYYELTPDVENPAQKVVFGTSGHRGASLNAAFNEAHIVATTAAIVEYRQSVGVNGPLFIGFDTHILSIPAFKSAVEVLAAAGIETQIDSHVTLTSLTTALERRTAERSESIWTPTPALSHAILRANTVNGQVRSEAFDPSAHPDELTNTLADGIVVTPSHNPPTDGGFKYNPAHGGPADSDATKVIAARANEYLKGDLWKTIKRIPFEDALSAPNVKLYDFREHYVSDLINIIDIDAIRKADVKIGADPLGGAAVEYWPYIAEKYNLNLTVVNPNVDPRWSFMTLDWDGKIRMDCSSPYSMNGLVGKIIGSDGSPIYDVATGNDADSDRHGIVTPDAADGKPGLMNPNHFLAVCIAYLFGKNSDDERNRADWPANPAVGKTLVSSSLIDRVAKGIDAKLVETPVGFKWFVPGLIDGSFGFGGEESAGASFLRLNGKVWTTDKDGIILDLLAAEIIAKTGKTPSALHRELIAKYGQSWYARIDAPATLEEKDKLSALSPEQVKSTELAGEQITAKLTTAPGNNAKIGGLKVTTENAWFAARPSGTENVYKIYAESFISEAHLATVQEEAKKVVGEALV